jgi:hypothetical protein
MTTKYDMIIPQSGTYRLVIDIVGGPDTLTGYIGSMQIRAAKGDIEELATVDPMDFDINDQTLQVVLEIPDEETGSWDWSGRAVYDMYIEGPSGDRWRILEGLATLSKTVTQEA